jgi:tRNA threonylcarbamoyladenosine biosynthesis protein TsaB
MALILCIETSTQVCSVALFNNHHLLGFSETSEKNAHSAVLTNFIADLMQSNNLQYADLDAVAVSSGPGSYTGLRIGVSVAKGLCYAASKPLIAVSTLRCIAVGVAKLIENKELEADYIIPMIDARRMEVYHAVFDNSLKLIQDVRAEIIAETTFNTLKGKLILCGDGALKCQEVFANQYNIQILTDKLASAKLMGDEALSKFNQGLFADLAYFEPFYLKDFIAGLPRVKGLD